MNRLKTILFLAFRIFSFGRKGEKLTRPLLGSILGIALSIIPLIVVIEISEGMIQGITERTLETFSYHLQTFPYTKIPLDQMIEQSNEIESHDFIRNSTVEKNGYGLIYSPEGKGGITIRSVEPDFYDSDSGVRKYIKLESGTFDLSLPDSVMVGRDIARKLKLSIGDEIKILTGKFFSNGKFLPKITKFHVKGVFSTGYDELDRMWVFIPLEQGDKILADSSSEIFIGIKTNTPYKTLKKDLLSLKDILPRRWGMYTWENINRAQLENYRTTRVLLIFIMALIVCVAIINISSSLVMLVMEKSEEISILKCLGASPSDITQSYIYTGLFTGITGTIGGVIVGLLISININSVVRGIDIILNTVLGFIRILLSPFIQISGDSVQLLNSSYYLDKISVTVNPIDLIFLFTLTIILSAISSAIPAYKAGKIKPLEVLRKH
ncbi:MAG: ABC transporter permease [Spirochaetaceae bacterium]|jgi:lipoprotein-releasing system permease protein|nr:ABC transporter permease [Spirochaetaceae bacterium]